MLLANELKLIFLLLYWKKCFSKFEGNIVNGSITKIEYFPHCALITSSCVVDESPQNHLCGASILNHRVLLTAAHCLEECAETNVDIIVTVGSADKRKGTHYIASSFYLHENYNHPFTLDNDIALVGVNYITLSDKVARVSIMKHPPYHEAAYVAGWGRVSDVPKKKSPMLMKTMQSVMLYEECVKYLKRLNKGTICGGKISSYTYISRGDSGNALIVKKIIQIGIVSHKVQSISSSVAVYTDVGYYYKWIKKHSKMVFCSVKSARNLKLIQYVHGSHKINQKHGLI